MLIADLLFRISGYLQRLYQLLHFGIDLARIHGLRKISVGAGLENLRFVSLYPDRDDGSLVAAIFLDAPANLQPIDARNPHVEDHDVRLRPSNFDKGANSIRRRHDFVPTRLFEVFGKAEAQLVLVLDNQDAETFSDQ